MARPRSESTGLVKAVHFPIAVLVVSSVIASLVAFLLSLSLLLLALLVTGQLTWATLLLLDVFVTFLLLAAYLRVTRSSSQL